MPLDTPLKRDRLERHLMRQRGAGVRSNVKTDFGFSFHIATLSLSDPIHAQEHPIKPHKTACDLLDDAKTVLPASDGDPIVTRARKDFEDAIDEHPKPAISDALDDCSVQTRKPRYKKERAVADQPASPQSRTRKAAPALKNGGRRLRSQATVPTDTENLDRSEAQAAPINKRRKAQPRKGRSLRKEPFPARRPSVESDASQQHVLGVDNCESPKMSVQETKDRVAQRLEAVAVTCALPLPCEAMSPTRIPLQLTDTNVAKPLESPGKLEKIRETPLRKVQKTANCQLPEADETNENAVAQTKRRRKLFVQRDECAENLRLATSIFGHDLVVAKTSGDSLGEDLPDHINIPIASSAQVRANRKGRKIVECDLNESETSNEKPVLDKGQRQQRKRDVGMQPTERPSEATRRTRRIKHILDAGEGACTGSGTVECTSEPEETDHPVASTNAIAESLEEPEVVVDNIALIYINQTAYDDYKATRKTMVQQSKSRKRPKTIPNRSDPVSGDSTVPESSNKVDEDVDWLFAPVTKTHASAAQLDAPKPRRVADMASRGREIDLDDLVTNIASLAPITKLGMGESARLGGANNVGMWKAARAKRR